MAKASWCTVVPASGHGIKTIAISATAHTGRTARSTTVTIQNQNGTKPSKAITVNQAEKALYITKVTSSPASLPSTGAILNVTGKCNAKMIMIREGWGDMMDAHEFKVNGVLQTDIDNDCTTPRFIITGDPGTAAEYTFESKITVTHNTSAKPRTLEFHFEGYSTDNETGAPVEFNLNVVQAGTASTLSTDKTSVSLTNAGATQNIVLTSNDDWVVS